MTKAFDVNSLRTILKALHTSLYTDSTDPCELQVFSATL